MKCKLIACLLLFICMGLWAQEATEKEKIIIGGDSDYCPYEFINDEGNPDGYNVELSQEIAKILGKEPVFRLSKWALAMERLDTSEIDVVQGMAFSVERAMKYHFSSAHAETWRTFFYRKDSNISRESDIMNKSVVIQQGDIAGEYLKKIGFHGTLNEVPNQEIALKLLSKGDFDVSLLNYTITMYIIRQENIKGIRNLPNRIYQRDYCFASKDPQLISEIDRALQILRQNGTLAALQNKWFVSEQMEPKLDSAQTIVPVFMVILLAFAFVLVLFWHKSVRNNTKTLGKLAMLEKNLQQQEKELNQWKEEFSRGPVVLYKCRVRPPKMLFISENVSNWGFSAEELTSTNASFLDIVFSEDKEKVKQHCQNLQPGKESAIYYRVLGQNGELCWVMDVCRIITSPEEEESCRYGYLIDVSEQKKLEARYLEAKEKAEAANIAKSHFLANMSHEIRTPLNGITGFLQVLTHMDASPEQREIYNLMHSSSRNLLKIINDILDFSKIESGKMELIESEFNLHYIIDDIIKQFSHQNKREHLVMNHQIDERIPDVMKGDQLRLKQILINLMQNAVKFTHQGKIEIGAELYTYSESDVRILFRVLDTGIGINPEKQKDIFDNYTQADSSITSKYGGTGLGLAIVKRLVELMHGFIWVESQPNKGSCFFFILPFRQYNEIDVPEPEISAEVVYHDKSLTGKILLAEDEPINQMVTRRQLETWGLQVEVVPNGLEALNATKQNDYDIILMDIQMPVMDGITATQKIRDLEVALQKHTPIVAFTAAALVGDRERFLAAGMDAYIAKPIDVEELYQILGSLLIA
ncbi:MAG: transporter substrate-binding domain-containing protein, partial [Candidatus Cloacimonetes bacterium]|nr:transporter substrate-binding domain-containing protein [Candidatus Cloacimonadota bacterium]